MIIISCNDDMIGLPANRLDVLVIRRDMLKLYQLAAVSKKVRQACPASHAVACRVRIQQRSGGSAVGPQGLSPRDAGRVRL